MKKYLRFIKAAGGWSAFQEVLLALDTIAKRHHVTIPAVATRFVLDIPPVRAVIVGTRLSEDSYKYTAKNLSAFSFKLTEEDHTLLAKAQESLLDIPGDCGDEYRRAPYLTASGDLSHHLSQHNENLDKVKKAVEAGSRIEYSSGSPWEPIAVSSTRSYTQWSFEFSEPDFAYRAIVEPYVLVIQFGYQVPQPTPKYPRFLY